jgi:Flp pilus assembly protein TadG
MGKNINYQQKGSVFTEAAIILPLIMTLIFGIAQYAMIFAAYITLTNAAAEGARFATTGASGGSGGVGSYTAGAIAPSLVPADAVVTVTGNFLVGGQNSQKVDITYPLNLFFPIVVPNSSNGVLQLSASSIAR